MDHDAMYVQAEAADGQATGGYTLSFQWTAPPTEEHEPHRAGDLNRDGSVDGVDIDLVFRY